MSGGRSANFQTNMQIYSWILPPPLLTRGLTRNRIIFIHFRKLFVIQAIASLASSFGKENKVYKVLFLRKCIVYRNKLCLVFCYTFYCNEIYTYDDIIKAYVENDSLLIITSRSTETQNDTRAFKRRNQLTINLRNQQSRDDDTWTRPSFSKKGGFRRSRRQQFTHASRKILSRIPAPSGNTSNWSWPLTGSDFSCPIDGAIPPRENDAFNGRERRYSDDPLTRAMQFSRNGRTALDFLLRSTLPSPTSYYFQPRL